MLKFHILKSESGDWEGIYLDGQLLVENHSVDAQDLLDALQEKSLCEVTSEEKDEQFFEDNDYTCPPTL